MRRFYNMIIGLALTGCATESTIKTEGPVSETDWSSDGSFNDGSGEDTSSGIKAWYVDFDGDRYGTTVSRVNLVAAPDDGNDWVNLDDDCNDLDADINPSAAEILDNLVDEDCDDLIETSSGGQQYVYYRDSDNDTYGAAASGTTTTETSVVPSGYVTNSTDCNDASSAVSPADTEVANGIDDDCDGSIDEGTTTSSTCASTESLVSGSFTAPSGSTITSLSGEAVGGSNAFSWTTLATGNPSGMTVTKSSNVVTFSYASCTADSSVWNMSVEYVTSGGTTQWDCQSSAFTGTWSVTRDSTADTVTVSSNGGSGCDAVF